MRNTGTSRHANYRAPARIHLPLFRWSRRVSFPDLHDGRAHHPWLHRNVCSPIRNLDDFTKHLPQLPVCAGTPMTDTTWRLSQFTILGIFLAILRIEDPFHGPLLSLWHLARQQTNPGPTKWRETLEMQVTMRRKWLKDGLRKSIELSAIRAPPTVDAYALEWTLAALRRQEEVGTLPQTYQIFRLQSRPGSVLGNPSPNG
ncbi:hypothetical protein EDB83DRAFT_252415 [Lactarius deliciosus]|nr:hypothetical protein EDB83DRAFT_252415 [Lactarius deliciosus]